MSLAVRVWETLGTDHVYVAGGRSVEAVMNAAEALRSYLRAQDVDASVEFAGAISGDDPVNAIRRLVAGLRGKCGFLVVSPSPASRRLATAVGLAARGLPEPQGVAIVLLDFLWGPWSGLPYPYVPRAVEPLLVLPPTGREALSEPRKPAMARGDLVSRGCKDPGLGGLPPLRCRVAELARRLNAATVGAHVYIEHERVWIRCNCRAAIKLSLNNTVHRINLGDPCSHEAWCSAAARLAELVEHVLPQLYQSRHGGRHSLEGLAQQLALFTGLRRIEPCNPSGEELGSARTIVDTSLVYAGIHNYAYTGARILLPYCAIVEVTRRYAESAKRTVEPLEGLTDLLAYTALEELEYAGASVAPSPATDCDIAIPDIDPLILNGTVLATRDTGAASFWQRHPASRIAAGIALVHDAEQGCRSPPRGMEHYAARRTGENCQGSRLGASWASYAVLQALVALKTLERIDAERMGRGRLSVEMVVDCGDGAVGVQVPALPVG
ncbi:hypothetical protein [Hyperthermus butylicus]|uniref:hypothetical protein n=1 Tax=Hyperthermus butylicus TaxID=54248 RepID=UPI00129BA8A5|nr:hypothetical protein [Hyperthermus butylicus]